MDRYCMGLREKWLKNEIEVKRHLKAENIMKKYRSLKN